MKTNPFLALAVCCVLVAGLAQSVQAQPEPSWCFTHMPRGTLPSGDTFTSFIVVQNESSGGCEIELDFHDGAGNHSSPDSFLFNGLQTTTSQIAVEVLPFQAREFAVTNPAGFSSGAVALRAPCPSAQNLNVFARFEVTVVDLNTGTTLPTEVFSTLPSEALKIPSSAPNPYISVPLNFVPAGSGETPRNLALAFSSKEALAGGTRLMVWMNNQNKGTVVGPILIPVDGSYQSQFVEELPGWPQGTFSDAFQGSVNLTLNIPNQQSNAPASLDLLFLSVVGSPDQFQFSPAPHIVSGQ